jgi:hypothetical protein
MSPAPIGPPQKLIPPTAALYAPSPTSQQVPSPQDELILSPERQRAERSPPEAKRLSRPNTRALKTERKSWEANRERKKVKKERRDPPWTTGTASGEEVMAFDDESRARRLKENRTIREVIRDDDAHVVEPRPATPFRPMFGLFGF